MKIIVINGSATAGKNSFINNVAKYYKGIVMQRSTVDTVKAAMTDYFGWKGEKHDKSDGARAFMSEIKDAWTKFNNGSFWELINFARECQKNETRNDCKNETLVFCHVREPEEIEKFVNYYKLHQNECITLLIRAGDRVNHVPDNHADQEVDNFDYDFYVENNNTEHNLKKSAEMFVKTLIRLHGLKVDRFDHEADLAALKKK